MRDFRKCALVVLVVGMLSNCGWAQDGNDEQNAFQLINGEIYLVGEFDDLSSIEIVSQQGDLSLGTIDTGLKQAEPFPNGAVVPSNTPNSIAYGVLGAGNSVDIAGETKTAIRYSQSLEVARTDLSINIGLADAVPRSVPVGTKGEFAERSATIIDGSVTFIGEFEQLAGIEAISPGGYLSLEALTLEGSTLFHVFDNNVLANGENRISITANNSVTLDGLTPTGIFFDGDIEAFAAAGISVLVGLGDAPPVALANAHIPEPAGGCLASWVVFLVLLRRNKRYRSFCSHAAQGTAIPD